MQDLNFTNLTQKICQGDTESSIGNFGGASLLDFFFSYSCYNCNLRVRAFVRKKDIGEGKLLGVDLLKLK